MSVQMFGSSTFYLSDHLTACFQSHFCPLYFNNLFLKQSDAVHTLPSSFVTRAFIII